MAIMELTSGQIYQIKDDLETVKNYLSHRNVFERAQAFNNIYTMITEEGEAVCPARPDGRPDNAFLALTLSLYNHMGPALQAVEEAWTKALEDHAQALEALYNQQD